MDKRAWLVLAALIALAFNLRSPLTAIPPVIGAVRASLGLDAAQAGLLTSIPVLCFGLLTPLVSLLISRTGLSRAVCITLTGAAIGLAWRPFGGVGGLFAGTLLIGTSLAIGNIASLMIIARDFPRQISSVTGIYTAALNIGTMLTGALTAPIATVTGWQPALAIWSVMALLALALWLWADRPGQKVALRQEEVQPSVAAGKPTPAPSPMRRRPIVWLLSAAFAAHLFIYYAITAWLPSYLIETEGMSPTQAGLVASAFQILSLIGALGVPLLARRFSFGLLLSAMGLLWLVTPLWMWIFPGQWPVWSLLGGIAQGGTFVVVFMLIMRHAADLDDNRRISTVVQGVGYSLASLGPILIGRLHEVTHGWTSALIVLSILATTLVLAGAAISRSQALARA
ncbi:CP family cyanate transporter-like MFS transporter [Sphingomonas sp. BE270]|jgi:CP family cyanate transporter-like MFS transporter|uniref:MFS transporter n=1 Tax=Sphingomonas sp. BE270 TaxID=2817726 RepID=UPI002857F4C5|nr:MFS transporter [Sphingomonas sp. BE270]MDR7260064.1 CP family cyanate transporter-like MFS transporter [Sphingomonas sp. BE270]